MNWLAHLTLAPDRPLERLGNLAGDFVKGPIDALAARYPAPLVAGIAAHRQLDQMTDAHPAFRASVRRIAPTRGLVAGIVVDICYDHFLSTHWRRWSDEPRETFIARCYAELTDHAHLLPPRLARAAPRLIEADWLGRYVTVDGIAAALDRTARRIRHPNRLEGAGAELVAHYDGLEADFLTFWPAARARAAELAS